MSEPENNGAAPPNNITALVPVVTQPNPDAAHSHNDERRPFPFALPAAVLAKTFEMIPVDDLLQCRLVCQAWNAVISDAEILDEKSCFVFDGRKEDAVDSTKCGEYMATGENKNYFWSHLKLRRVLVRHCTWLFRQIETDPKFGANINKLELLNSTLNWTNILQLLLDLENLRVFYDRQDVYCWDYATFNSGIEEGEGIPEAAGFKQFKNRDLSGLNKLRVVHIHRSQLIECTTYLKILEMNSNGLRELEVHTDQNFAPQRGLLFYQHLERVLLNTGGTLRVLKFPYKVAYPAYDFRATDDHHLFREFLSYVSEHDWAGRIRLPNLEEFSLQFGIIPVSAGLGQPSPFPGALLTFLQQGMPNLKNLQCGCIHADHGSEGVLQELWVNRDPSNFTLGLGVFMNDNGGGIPRLPEIVQKDFRSISLQTFRDSMKDLAEMLPLNGIGVREYRNLQEFQYFSKNHTFRNFSIRELVYSFPNLTHLNLVDHNARLETRHSSEALATIEDDDMQLIIGKLDNLVSLQCIGNMTFLTDQGLTGIMYEVCSRMFKNGNFQEARPNERMGYPISHLQKLRALVLRGLGIKVTDVSARLAFKKMPHLVKLHVHGCHQIGGESRLILTQMYNSTKGCDLQF